MPLRPENVTIASRVLFSAFPVLSDAFGVNLLATSSELAQTPFYVGMDNIAALERWVLVFLAIAAALTAKLVIHIQTYENASPDYSFDSAS